MTSNDRFNIQGSGDQNANTGNGAQANNTGWGNQFNINWPPPTSLLNRDTVDPTALKESILKSLSFARVRHRCHEIDRPYPQTCDWLFLTSEFKKWEAGVDLTKNNGVLWIKGKPGVGKSTLMKHTLHYCQRNLNDHIILSYFFNAKGDTLEKTPFGMMRSLVAELLGKDSGWYEKFIGFFPEKKWIHKPGEEWKWEQFELEDFLRSSLKPPISRPIVVLIDALDECDGQTVSKVVGFLKSLSSHAVQDGFALKICLSSRHYPSINMSKMLELIVEKREEHERDIALYIENELESQDPRIRTKVQRKAGCTFMWVVLVVAILNQKDRQGQQKAMFKALEELPDDLEQLLDALLQTKEGDADREKTTLLLQWVLLSQRILKSEELYSVIDGEAPPDSETAKKYIIYCSKGLVEFKETLDTEVHFIHLSVNDYLVQNKRLQALDPKLGDDPVQASHGCLWSCCWKHLEPITKAKTHEAKVNEKNPFLQYAAEYILAHANEAIITTSTKIYTPNEPTQQSMKDWLREHDSWLKWRNNYVSKANMKGENVGLLYTLVTSEHFNLAQFALAQDTDVHAQGGSFGNALQAAVYLGHGQLVEQILKKGADVNAQGGRFYNALAAAVHFGYEVMVELLLVHGAHANSRFNSESNALQAAVYLGRADIARLLLKYGADANVQGGQYGNVLQTAIYHGETAIVQLLLEHEANVNAQGGRYGTALQAAVNGRNLKMVELLLEKDADVNVQGGVYGDALQAAVFTGKPKIVALLLDNGARIRSEGKYSAALRVIRRKKDKERIRKLLLKHGANLEDLNVVAVVRNKDVA